MALLPVEERLRHVRADRWIGYTRAADAIARLETLFAWPDKQRMPNLLLIGPTNNGKSMIVANFRRMHPPVSHPDHEHIEEMAAYLLTRSEGTIGELARLLTDAAIAAIDSGEEAINQRTLLMAGYAGPTERRRLFERELA